MQEWETNFMLNNNKLYLKYLNRQKIVTKPDKLAGFPIQIRT